MRLLLSFLLNEPFIPIDYRSSFQSFIKRSLHESDNEYFEELYSNNTAKDFCFSVMLGDKPVFKDDRINLGDTKITMTFSAHDSLMFLSFYNAFVKQKNKEFPLAFSNKMKLIGIRIVKRPVITSSSVLVKFSSPLIIRKHDSVTNKDHYMSFDEPDFEAAVINAVKVQSERSLGQDITSGMRFVPVMPKKTVVKTMGNSINANLGVYKIEANPGAISYLLEAGQGSRKSQGFGLMELIQQ